MTAFPSASLPSAAPREERGRISALHGLSVLDTPPEPEFDDIVSLAARLARMPIAAISLVDDRRQWFKACLGVPFRETPREVSLCQSVVLDPAQPLIVTDARADERFAASPLVRESPYIRGYAGVPLLGTTGFVYGALCVADSEPRRVEPEILASLTTLARHVVRLLESRQRLCALQEKTAAMERHAHVAIVGLDGHVIRANPRLLESLGLTLTELTGAGPVHAAPHPLHEVFRETWRGLAAGETWRGEVCLRGARAAELWLDVSASPIKGADGRPQRYFAIATDISERKRQERQLRLLGSALEQSGDAIVLTNADLSRGDPRVVHVNRAFCRMTGYAAEEMVGQSFDLLHGAQTDPAMVETLREALRQGRPLRGETVHHRKDGSAYDVEWHWAPIRDRSGNVTHFVNVQRDVTARRRAEEELRRTREEAREAVRLKTRFLANMSHELRTPLNTINGLSATLVEQDLPAASKEAVRLILQCGESLLENIQTILTHSTLEAGQARLDTKPVVLTEIVAQALGITSEAARRRRLSLEYFIDPRTPHEVLGDPFRLQQILVNLLANAIKFTEQGRVLLRVKSRRRPDGTWDISFCVADTGIGIAPADQAGLFQPFHQVDASATRRFEGTGLGLAIVRSLTELMGGRVRLRSRVGRGSVFRVSVRFAAVGDGATVYSASAQPEFRGRRILILDTPRPAARLLATMFQAWGAVPVAAPSLLDGVARLGREKFDAVIRSLPRGEAATIAAFDQHTRAAGLPIVWITPSAGIAGDLPSARHARLGPLFSTGEASRALLKAIRGATAATAEPAPARESRRLGERLPLRILSADDTHTNRDMLSYICRHLGYKTDMVENGAEVLDRLAQASYDLILLDVQMPVLDGLATAREICRRFPDPTRRPRVVAVTASVQMGDRERCLAAGMDAYLCKPILPRNLQACIETLFSAEPAAAPSSDSRPPVPVNLPPPWVKPEHLRATTQGLDDLSAVALLTEIYAVSQNDLSGLHTRLTDACARRDAAAVATCIHGMKGCVLALGWARIGSHCAETLHAIREGRFSSWDELPAEIDEMCRMSAQVMDRILPELFAVDRPAEVHPGVS